MKKIFLLLLLLSGGLFAANNTPTLNFAQPRFAPDPDFQYTFDHLSSIPAARKYRLGTVLWEAHNTIVCQWDFANQGGAVGTHNMVAEDGVTPCTVPGKAIIRNGFLDVTTSITGGGSATLAVSSGQTAADLLAATLVTSLSSGRYATIPVFGTVSSYVKISTADSVVNGVNLNPVQPYVTVGTANLTAGHFRLFIDYVRGE